MTEKMTYVTSEINKVLRVMLCMCVPRCNEMEEVMQTYKFDKSDKF